MQKRRIDGLLNLHSWQQSLWIHGHCLRRYLYNPLVTISQSHFLSEGTAGSIGNGSIDTIWLFNIAMENPL